MRQQGPQNTNLVMGVAAGAILLLGALAFLFVLNLGPVVPGEGTQQAVSEGPARHESLPAPPTRDFVANPMTVEDKREIVPHLTAALGALEGGWQLRPFSHRDVRALRTDLIDCPVSDAPGPECATIYTGDGKGLWIYEQGDKKIAVGLTYTRGGGAVPRGNISAYKVFDLAFEDVFEKGAARKDWKNAGRHIGFDLIALEAPKTQEGQRITLQRLEAQVAGDGEVKVYIAANTDRATALGVLDALDHAFINAMVAPAVMSREEALASIQKRSKRFVVLSDEDLRTKVAEMSRKSRNSYAKALMKDALEKGRGPDGYKVTYQALGEAGRIDTVNYLTGAMKAEHPGYKTLRYEHLKRLPIGACVRTDNGLYCEKAAQTMRIVQEIRRITGADQKPAPAGWPGN